MSCFRARDPDVSAALHVSVEEMAKYHCRHVRLRKTKGPISLIGYSFGGLVAYEMGRLLAESGEPVELVGLIDAGLHETCLPFLRRRSLRAQRIAHRSAYRLSEKAPRWSGLLRKIMRPLERSLEATRNEPAIGLQKDALTAFRSFRPKRSPVPLVFFRPMIRAPGSFDAVPLWRNAVSGNFAVVEVPGDHFSMVRDPQVQVLARRIGECLRAPRRDRTAVQGSAAGLDTRAVERL